MEKKDQNKKTISKLEDQKVETDKVSGGKTNNRMSTSGISAETEGNMTNVTKKFKNKMSNPIIGTESPDGRSKTVIKAERNTFND